MQLNFISLLHQLLSFKKTKVLPSSVTLKNSFICSIIFSFIISFKGWIDVDDCEVKILQMMHLWRVLIAFCVTKSYQTVIFYMLILVILFIVWLVNLISIEILCHQCHFFVCKNRNK